MRVLCVSAAFLLLFAARASASEPFVDITFDDACRQARSDGKVVLIDFYTEWCGPCKLLDRTTWPATEVITAVTAKAIALRVDAEKDVVLAKRYSVESYPTVLIVRPDGVEIDRLTGYREPAAFMRDFPGALAGRGEVARAREVLAKSGLGDVAAGMALGLALKGQRDYAGALEQYLHCISQRSAANPITKMRLFTELLSLSKDYPPARKTMETMRDQGEAAVLTAPEEVEPINDVVYLNTGLKSPERNLALFDRLPRNSKARNLLRSHVVQQFLAAGRYQDVLDGENPTATFEQQMAQIAPLLLKVKPAQRAMLEPVRARLAAGAVAYFQALLGVGRVAEGKSLANRILKIDPTPATLAQLVHAANDAGHSDLGSSLRIPG